jgi:hypothetical protein
MSKSKIYSLTTVGLLKHFNQDYQFHEERTDFTGRNGVGKSIIADLLQIIFVGDKKSIKFGTGGINPDKRTIHSLPYKQNEAYAFLNIEIEDNNFIVVGVCISSNPGVPLKPFVILKTANINDNIEYNYFDRPITSSDFLDKSGRVFSLKKLASNLLNERKVHLRHFVYSEDLGKYYSFLYSKEILSINLGINENLKAFSTVIQSFSRANTLKLSSSKSLKDFLFEASNKEYLDEYRKLETDLSKLMVGFNRLDKKIIDIKKKQLELSSLKKYSEALNKNELLFNQYKLAQKWSYLEQARKDEKEKEKILKKNQEKRKKIELRIEKLKRIYSTSKKQKEIFDSKSILVNKLSPVLESLFPIETEINSLNKIDETIFMTSDKIQLSEKDKIESYELIKPYIDNSKILIQKYGSIENMDKVYENQNQLIRERRLEIERLIKRNKKLHSVLSNSTEDSLLHFVLSQAKELSKEQEEVILALSDLKMSKPQTPNQNDKYAISSDIIDSKNLELNEDNSGVWLKQGDIVEFFEFKQKDRLLDNPKEFAKAINTKIQDINEEITLLEKRLEAISETEKGNSCTDEALKNEIDLSIVDYSHIKNVKSVIAFIQNKQHYIQTLEKNSKALIEEKESLFNMLEIKGDAIPEKFNEKISNCIIHFSNRVEKFNTIFGDESTTCSGLKGAEPFLINDLEKSRETLGDCKKEYDISNLNFKKRFETEELDFLNEKFLNENDHNNIKEVFEKTREDYVTQYRSMTGRFEETKNNKDVSITLQLENRTFSFSVLERALLGNKINHLDNITPYLQDMNTERKGFVNDIYEKMIKIFSKTREQYEKFDFIVKDLNTFFKDKKISGEYFFNLVFKPNKYISIDWIYLLQEKAQGVFLSDELQMGESVEDFIEDFFKKTTKFKGQIKLKELLDPKTYFELSVKLVDEDNIEIPGSTGETYSAIVLLGIARLSKVQTVSRNGVRFIILEESSNLDITNFNTFPKIAKEYGYQIITMTPKPYGSDTSDSWYLHHLIKGKDDKNINHPVPASYFKTKNTRETLTKYLSESSL